MRWSGHEAHMGEINAYIFIGMSEGKRPRRRHRREWEDNIRMNLGKHG